MPNECLDQWLQIFPRENEGCRQPRVLSFLQRLNIPTDVNSALDYLHHLYQVPVIHCDVKPNNALIDNDMVVHLGDFGLARIFPNAILWSERDNWLHGPGAECSTESPKDRMDISDASRASYSIRDQLIGTQSVAASF
ncbi:receptor-kinase, putative [Ricinus communis]|uniref:Receptor-kinase, putative n=1 Tax=Ricinus communis TaxID=3988 RepID=B9SI07_RICCO|nr:receptor-kinase, putative [Ricinus communis]